MGAQPRAPRHHPRRVAAGAPGLGHAWLWDRWSQALHDRLPDPEVLVAAQERSSAFMFDYIDLISGALGGRVRDRARADDAQRGAAARRERPLSSSPGGRSTRKSRPADWKCTSCARARRAAPRVGPRTRAAGARARRPRGRRGAGSGPAARRRLGRRPASTSGGVPTSHRSSRGPRRLPPAGGDPGRRRAARARGRRLPALACRGARGGARGGAGRGRSRGRRHALPTCVRNRSAPAPQPAPRAARSELDMADSRGDGECHAGLELAPRATQVSDQAAASSSASILASSASSTAYSASSIAAYAKSIANTASSALRSARRWA